MSGKATGGHALAIGNGVLGSWLASVATQAGRTLAEKRSAAAAPAQPAVAPALVLPAIQGPPALPEPGFPDEAGMHGPLREVVLTPEADALEGPGDWLPKLRPRRRRPGKSPGRRGRPLAHLMRRRRRRAERDFDEPFDEDDFDSASGD